MGGIAAIAKSQGHTVTGSDQNVYPPMSTQLENLGITLTEGFDETQFHPIPDVVIIGNAMSRGNPAVEYVLNRNIPYISGPQWLLENVLQDRWVVAVSGTHGKTTTSSMVAWLLESAGLNPGFLIGGVPQNFGISARLGDSPFFVIEADEYDSAFFDKRSKFVHYHPRTLVINNLEFDHADIFADLAAIQTQFHHLIRTVPGNGLILSPNNSDSITQTLAKGCWSEQQFSGSDWRYELIKPDGSAFSVLHQNKLAGEVHWDLLGLHNVENGLMAIAAAHHAGVTLEDAITGLAQFKNVKRRLEVRGEINGITVYDDFAHHPTAIELTLQGLREKVGAQRIFAILEPRSNTMKMGHHKEQLVSSWQLADETLLLEPKGLNWSLRDLAAQSTSAAQCFDEVGQIIDYVIQQAKPTDHILIMSNGGFDNIHQRLLDALAQLKETDHGG